MSEVIRSCDVVDELVTDEGSVVLQEVGGGHHIARLSVLGQLVRELAAEGISLDALARELESRLGPAAGVDTLQATADAVAVMEAGGLLTRLAGEEANVRNISGEKP